MRDVGNSGAWVAYLGHQSEPYIRGIYIAHPQNGVLGLSEQIKCDFFVYQSIRD